MIIFSDLTERLNKIKEQTSALTQVVSDGTNAINIINNTPECADLKNTALDFLKKAVNDIIGEQEVESGSDFVDEDLDFE